MKFANLLLCTAALTAAFAPAAYALSSGWAVVNAGGIPIRSQNISAVSHPGTGTYIVDFTHSVKKCVFTATIGDASPGTPPAGYVTVAGANGDAPGVYVAVFDKNGDAADIGFHLNVRC